MGVIYNYLNWSQDFHLMKSTNNISKVFLEDTLIFQKT